MKRLMTGLNLKKCIKSATVGVANLMHPFFDPNPKHKGPTGKKPVGPLNR